MIWGEYLKFRIKGIITEMESLKPVPNLLVRAYDKDIIYDDLLGTAITAEDGSFVIGFEEKDFKEIFEGAPEIYFVVYGSTTVEDPSGPESAPLHEEKNPRLIGEAPDQYYDIQISRQKLGDNSPSGPIIPLPEPGPWKEKVRKYLKEHPIQTQLDAKPILIIEQHGWPPPDHWGHGNYIPMSVTIKNVGNAPSLKTCIESWDCPINQNLPWINCKLMDTRTFSNLYPGQQITYPLVLGDSRTEGWIICVVYDVFLDPRPPTPDINSRQVTGVRYTQH